MPSLSTSLPVVSLASLMVSPVLLHAGPACAEILYLRNGTRLEGRIQKQDESTLEVVTASGIVKVPRETIALATAPNPWIAMGMGVALPGGGQIWLGQQGRGWTVAGVTVASGAFVGLASQALFTGRFVGADGSLLPGSALGMLAAMVPWGLGAWEAWQAAEATAERDSTQPRLRIDY